MKRLVWYFGLFLILGAGLGCSDDEVKSGGAACADGEQYNPILDQCEPDGFDNGGEVDPGNSDPGNSGTNGSTNNSNNGQPVTDGGMTAADAGTTTEDSGFDVPDLPCGTGSLIGRACAPSGDVLAAADVKITGVDCDGNAFEVTTRTAGDGTFEFDEVPSGTHTLEVSTGSFNNSRSVFVRAGILNDYTAASEKVCVDSDVSIAVVKGAYDSVEDVLDRLNLSYDFKGADRDDLATNVDETKEATDFLTDVAAMSQYDVIMINCGELYIVLNSLFNFQYPRPGEVVSALQQFVAQGGSLYISDWAHPFFELAFPDLIDFYGDDAAIDPARWGYAPQDIIADVMSPELQTTLGANTATIDFPHNPPAVINNNWVVPTATGASTTIHLQGSAELCSTKRCNSSSSSQANTPLLVSHKASGGGTVVFTSFHNHSDPSAPVSAEMEKILRFLILQL